MLDGNILIIVLVVAEVARLVLVFLIGIVERELGGVKVVAHCLRFFQVLLHIHGGKLLRGHPGKRIERERRGQLLPDHGVELTAQLCDGGIKRRFSALHLRLARFRLLKRHGADLTELIAQLHFLDRAVKRRGLTGQGRGLVLQAQQVYVERLPRHQKLVFRVAELADQIGIILLELTVLNVVEGLAQRIVLILKTLIGVRLARTGDLQHHPLGLRDLVEAVAQVLVHFVVVYALDRGDVLLQRHDGVIARFHPCAEVFKAQRACRVRRGLRGLLRGGFLFVLFICQRADRQR